MSLTRTKLVCVAALIFALGVPVADARVFLSGGGAPLADVSEEAGLKLIYQTEYKINGADAALEVYGGELDLQVVTARMQRGFQARQLNASIPVSSTGAMGVVSTKTELTRMIFMSPAPGKTLVYAVRQDWNAVSRFNAAAARGESPNVTLPNIPHYPGGRLIYHVEDQRTKTLLAVYRVSGSPEVAKSFYAQSLPENGWQSVGGTGMYRRGALTCMVSALANEQSGELTVTLLVRETNL